MNIQRNLSMLMDFYELTMSNGYWVNDLKDTRVVFDLFYRKNPDGAGFAIVAGLQQVIEYIENLSFTEEDLTFLRSKTLFNEDFLEFLKEFRFNGNIYAIPEGTPVFPNEPLITVEANIIEAQLIETMLLLTVNHQSLIATKSNRMVRAASGRSVLEFGARRAQGYDGAIYGSRAAFIGGVNGTATTIAEECFSIPASGTMAHSWIQLFEDEYLAFETYAKTYPDHCVLLVDTYNVLKSGIPNAILVAKNVLQPLGKRLKGIRLDSGDIAYLSKEARKLLDQAGLNDCQIIASNSLDEYIIKELLEQGACIDAFGVGERLVTSKSDPVFGGVYKLVAVLQNQEYIPRIKISENTEKVTNPGYKKIYRMIDIKTNQAIADVITLKHETIDESKPYVLFDPVHTWKKTTIENYKAIELQVPIFIDGKCVYPKKSIHEIREYSKNQLDLIWNEVKRFTNPHQYYVDLSLELYELKQSLIQTHKR